MNRAGIESIVCTINDSKPDLIKYLNIFFIKHQLSMAYVYQNMYSEEYGVPYSIYQASDYLYGHTVVMRFPDTIVLPEDCIRELLDLENKSAIIIRIHKRSVKRFYNHMERRCA